VSELPARPSLDHLRKQAKALLKTLRQENPDASLTEAQHAVAGQYGFASWPRLKAHVEQLAARSEPPIFPRFTPKARESLFFSWHEAHQLRSGVIEPGHLLLGLIRVGAGLEPRIFRAADLDTARALIAARVKATVPVPSDRRIVLGDRVQRVFRAAVEEADSRHHERVGLAHLLLAAVRQGDATLSGLLDQLGIGPPEGGPHDDPIWLV
jgi:hypothetical protein